METIIVIILILLWVCYLLWFFYIRYKIKYNNIRLNGIYIKRYKDPWKQPMEVRITGKSNGWIRFYIIHGQHDGYYESMCIKQFIDEGFVYNNYDAIDKAQ